MLVWVFWEEGTKVGLKVWILLSKWLRGKRKWGESQKKLSQHRASLTLSEEREREEGQGKSIIDLPWSLRKVGNTYQGNACIRAALQKRPVSPSDGPDLVSLLYSVTGREQPVGSMTSEQTWQWILDGDCWGLRSVRLPIVGGLWVHSRGCHGDWRVIRVAGGGPGESHWTIRE